MFSYPFSNVRINFSLSSKLHIDSSGFILSYNSPSTMLSYSFFNFTFNEFGFISTIN